MKLFSNGQYLDAAQPLFEAANRSFRYGEGLFETIRVLQGAPLLWNLHFSRLEQGMQALELPMPADFNTTLLTALTQLCSLNHCFAAARARLALYRKPDEGLGYVLELFPLSEAAFRFNETGWVLGLYGQVRKQQDSFSNLKTANYLPYLMADRFAAQNSLDECLVYNGAGQICDGSRTNIFLVKNSKVITPSLASGCIAGVMRHHLLAGAGSINIDMQETDLVLGDLLAADEIFLTNAIQGIRWVQSFQGRQYGNVLSRELYRQLVATIYP